MKRAAILGLLLLPGCSTAPIADLFDFFRPAKIGPERVAPYGGVCNPRPATPPGVPAVPGVPPGAIPAPPPAVPGLGPPGPAVPPPDPVPALPMSIPPAMPPGDTLPPLDLGR